MVGRLPPPVRPDGTRGAPPDRRWRTPESPWGSRHAGLPAEAGTWPVDCVPSRSLGPHEASFLPSFVPTPDLLLLSTLPVPRRAEVYIGARGETARCGPEDRSRRWRWK
jgi:hypothetical protein